jgi:hypothetical protein
MNHQAEPELILPEEVLQTQELEEAVMSEGAQQLLNPDEWSEYALPSKKTPPVTGKGKAALQSATGRNLGIGH